jgi:C1A family cysteine protease
MVTAEEGRRLVEEGRMAVLPTDLTRLRAEAEAQRLRERARVREYLSSHPEAAESMELLLAPDGEGLRTMTIGEERGALRSVTLDGNDVMIADLAGSLVRATDHANVLAIYARLWAYAEPSGLLRDGRLPTPEASATLTVDEIKRNTDAILAQRLAIKQRIPLPPGTVEDFPDIGPDAVGCVGGFHADAGNGYGGDQIETAQGCSLSWAGIVANDARPYRDHLSCVRNQNNRGTCGAFAIASALEMAHSFAHAKRINLSEQMLFFRYKSKGLEPYTKDGMKSLNALQQFAAAQTRLPFELAWDYNPSFDRVYIGGPSDELFRWEQSCTDYDEECSDTTPQGEYTCVRKSPREKISPKYCGLVAPPNVGGVRLTTPPLSAWDHEDINGSLDAVKALLDAGSTVVLRVMVNSAFKGADNLGGYLKYNGGSQVDYGTHAVHVVHYIENDELAAIVPDAPPGDAGPTAPEGEQGGYFIVRNSWGPCWCDGGYMYIPYRWLRVAAFVGGAYAIDPAGVQPAP